MIDRGHRLALSRQARLLEISRGSLYYDPCPVSVVDLAIMRRIDELHLDYPFAGSRMLRDLLRGEGIAIGRDRVTAMMRRMGIEATYRRPHTSKPADGHKVCPYLLRGMTIERPNQVWAMDITYIPMARGFVFLMAVVDWFSRRVLAWRVSIGMDVDFCLDALDEALARHGRPEIFIPIKAASSPAQRSPACCWGTLSGSAWMAAARGATTCSSSGCGGRSNTKRSTCVPMIAWPRRAVRSAVIWPSIIARGRTRALTDARLTKPISVAWRWRRQHDVRCHCEASLWSGYALPTRRPTTAIEGDSWQGNHLSGPKRCSDQPGHL
jgi:putative transposase